MWTSAICWSVASERQIIRSTHSNAKVRRLGNIDKYFNFIYFEIPTIGTYYTVIINIKLLEKCVQHLKERIHHIRSICAPCSLSKVYFNW